MNQFDRERERIGRLREEGYLTAYEHQRRAAMIDRSEKRASNAAARAEAKRVAKARCYARTKLRRQLAQSVEQGL